MTYYRIDDIQPEDSGLTYVTVSIWPNRGAFQRGDEPAERQDFRMQLPSVGATQQTKRRRGQNYVKADDSEWTEAEYAAEYMAYKRQERTHPSTELAFDAIAVDHAALIEANIERYIAKQEGAGRTWRGDQRAQSVRTRASRVDGVAELPTVKALKGKERER